jgi:hypothetical protein
LARRMVDWEFWGNPMALKAIGIGLIVTVVGIVLGFCFCPICLGLAFIGVIIMGVASFYLVYWENWVLLQQKKQD